MVIYCLFSFCCLDDVDTTRKDGKVRRGKGVLIEVREGGGLDERGVWGSIYYMI